MRSQLYRHIARAYLPTPSPNFVRVVINGETWGIYVNTQPLDETFTREHFNSPSGARWLATSAPISPTSATTPRPTATSRPTTPPHGPSSSISAKPSTKPASTNSKPPSPRSSTFRYAREAGRGRCPDSRRDAANFKNVGHCAVFRRPGGPGFLGHKGEGGVGLRVEVDEEHALAVIAGEVGGEVDGDRRLADAAFHVEE